MTIFDGLQAPYEIETAAFLGNWSGLGICVSDGEQNPMILIWLGRSCLLLVVLIGMVLLVKNRKLVSRINHTNSVKQLSAIGAASILFAIAGNAVFGDMLHHGKGVMVAAPASWNRQYRNGTLDDARKASVSGDHLLIDARREKDYRLGTIPGAVNIPVTASTWAIHTFLENLERHIPIVVFCQSAACPYDETIGSQLVSLGFDDVTVCNEGWVEYQKAGDIAQGQ